MFEKVEIQQSFSLVRLKGKHCTCTRGKRDCHELYQVKFESPKKIEGTKAYPNFGMPLLVMHINEHLGFSS